MDPLTLFDALAVTAMLVLSALEGRSAVFGPTFAGACPASSATEPYLTGERDLRTPSALTPLGHSRFGATAGFQPMPLRLPET